VAKYAGSTLWGAMVYAGLRTLHPRASILAALSVAATIALGVEFSRLYHQPGLDAFRSTMAGRLLLGNIFSVWNLVAYGAGIVGAALGEVAFGWRREG
jgi:hypothetical protein